MPPRPIAADCTARAQNFTAGKEAAPKKESKAVGGAGLMAAAMMGRKGSVAALKMRQVRVPDKCGTRTMSETRYVI